MHICGAIYSLVRRVEDYKAMEEVCRSACVVFAFVEKRERKGMGLAPPRYLGIGPDP
jgi:hypothetical protein